jgi:hypothetical protein
MAEAIRQKLKYPEMRRAGKKIWTNREPINDLVFGARIWSGLE